MSDLSWKTSITDVHPNKLSVRGYALDKLMGRISFSQAVYLILKGEMPSAAVGRMVDAIFVSSIDHGASPPSALAARTVASTGAELNSAVATGVLAISRFHGGAIENAMRLYLKIADRMEADGVSEQEAVAALLREMKENKQRASGFGHRVHTRDPRATKLFALADELDLTGRFIRIARAVQEGLRTTFGRELPINVDGAIAAVLCDLDIPPEIGNAFFIIARVPGLVAQVNEEKTRMKTMRKIHPTAFEYDGPSEREP